MMIRLKIKTIGVLNKVKARQLKSQKRQRAFTLLELMVVLAIVGALAAVAIPSYHEVVKKSRRADAQGALQAMRQAMERHYTVNYTYATTTAAGSTVPLATFFPSESPLEGNGRKYYDLRIRQSTAASYEIAAIPKNGQETDSCGTLVLGSDGSLSADDTQCWPS